MSRITYQVYIPARLRELAEAINKGSEGTPSLSKFFVQKLEELKKEKGDFK